MAQIEYPGIAELVPRHIGRIRPAGSPNFITGCCAVGSAPALGAGRSPFKPENTVTAIPWYAYVTGTSPASRGGQKNCLTTCLTTSGAKLNYQKSGISAVGSALALGARCREFESPISDQQKQVVSSKTACFCNFLPYLPPNHYLHSALTISLDYLSQEDSFLMSNAQLYRVPMHQNDTTRTHTASG